MFNEVCDAINTVDTYFDDYLKETGEHTYGSLLNKLFSYDNCSNDDPKLVSEFITLLTLFNGIDSDKLVEYAILWLSYKLNQKKENETTKLYDFYTEHIETNSCYKENIGTDSKIKKDDICKKIKSMNIDIKDISNFYDAFKSLCNMYSEIIAEDYQCNKCLENAGEFFEKCEKVKNAFDINKGSSYLQLWSSLSSDYYKFKEKYNSLVCIDSSSLVACPRSSVTKNIIIPIAIIFVAASILLGISYKYSLFGFRKRSQKQHLREKLKK
ncbi:PIR protein [Plasmodium yoelii]|uniref:PIR protein n=2 Tax=Plasmodium yoelii TaxID=5861 RepID=A0AAE9WVV4_PLAYO|nr:PIR protein [Plasmodium yoelii]WBY61368.1 PIR protein [Plasmodium yoelii yoelii]VTZ82022.1 PIR protein [Plasmodium yoelii]|eukprot:XP_022810905.1 PIR protein [Plasmodium yoelii]